MGQLLDSSFLLRNVLLEDADEDHALEDFSYSRVVGMLLYFARHTKPDIAYAVNCSARYIFCPKRSHELALKRIGQYLKTTCDCGLIINPSRDLKIDCYPDADFARMCGYENLSDPSQVKSRIFCHQCHQLSCFVAF